jgi:hypothetical protein
MIAALATGAVAGGEPSPVGWCGGPCCRTGTEARLGRAVRAGEAEAAAVTKELAAGRVYHGVSCCSDWGTFVANNVCLHELERRVCSNIMGNSSGVVGAVTACFCLYGGVKHT